MRHYIEDKIKAMSGENEGNITTALHILNFEVQNCNNRRVWKNISFLMSVK